MPAVFGMRPVATRMSLASIVCSPAGVRDCEGDTFAGSALHGDGLGGQHEPDAFLTQNAVHRLDDIRVLPAHDLRPVSITVTRLPKRR